MREKSASAHLCQYAPFVGVLVVYRGRPFCLVWLLHDHPTVPLYHGQDFHALDLIAELEADPGYPADQQGA